MSRKRFEPTSDSFEQTVRVGSRNQRYVLRLYVTGATARSMRAIRNIKAICEDHLQGRYILEIIDIYQKPELARGDQIVAAPTLIKRLPEPLRRFIGDMSRTEHILLGLDLRSNHSHNSHTENDEASPGIE